MWPLWGPAFYHQMSNRISCALGQCPKACWLHPVWLTALDVACDLSPENSYGGKAEVLLYKVPQFSEFPCQAHKNTYHPLQSVSTAYHHSLGAGHVL